MGRRWHAGHRKRGAKPLCWTEPVRLSRLMSESWRESDDGKAIAQHAGGQHGGLGHNTPERLFAAVTALCRCGATKYAAHSILSLFAR